MLKTRVQNYDINVLNLVCSEDFSSDRDYYFNKLLGLGAQNTINSVIDAEVYEYKPTYDIINFNVFFLRYMQENELTEITEYMEPSFVDHVLESKHKFGLLDPVTNLETERSFNNVYEHQQPGGGREITPLGDINKTSIAQLLGKPYQVRDVIGEGSLLKPLQTGLPIFYNSFTFPFWDMKESWSTNSLLYKNKPFFYNSFLLMEFFDSPETGNQNRILSIPVFINNRYNFRETNNKIPNLLYERPVFNLIEGIDGYSFFFLKNYIKKDFYVRFSFWDALNSRKIMLVPSSDREYNKKWFQNLETFKQNVRYLKYSVDYKNRNYKIYEYNEQTKLYNVERNVFDLYELAYDPYWLRKPVKNIKPVDAKTIVAATSQVSSPFKFNIEKIDKTINVTPTITVEEAFNRSKERLLSEPSILTPLCYNIFNVIHENEKTRTGFNNQFNYANVTENTIFKTTGVRGLHFNIESLSARNIDTVSWKIRKMEIKNIQIVSDTGTYNTVFTNSKESAWNENPKRKIAEAMVLPGQYVKQISIRDVYADMFETLDGFGEFCHYMITQLTIGKKQRFQSFNKDNIFSNFMEKVYALLNIAIRSDEYENLFGRATDARDAYLRLMNGTQEDKLKVQEVNRLLREFIELFGSANYFPEEAASYIHKMTRFVSLSNAYLNKGDLYRKLVVAGMVAYPNSLRSFESNPPSLISALMNPPADYQPKEFVFDTYIDFTGDNFTIIPGAEAKFDLKFLIGEKVLLTLDATKNLSVTGEVVINVTDDKNNNKSFKIPFKFKITI